MAANLKWYHVDQNNSGGSLKYDAEAGLSANVFIQAPSLSEAVEVQERIGALDNGGSCSCCGDRWSELSDYDSVDDDQIPEKDDVLIIDKNDKNSFAVKWLPEGQYESFIHPWKGDFYGAHAKVKEIPRTMTGFGMIYTDKRVGNIYPVSEDGWSEDGNIQAPAPESSSKGLYGVVEDEPNICIKQTDSLGHTTYMAWARKLSTLESLRERVETYVALQAENAMDVQGMVRGL